MDKPCASWAVMVSLATGSAAWRLAPPEVCRRWRRGGVIGTPPFPAPGPATGRRWSRCKVCPGKRSPGRAQNNSSHNEVGTAASLWVHSSQLIHLFLSLYLSVSVCLSINDQVNRKLDSTANFKLIALPLFMGKYMKWKSSGRVKLFLNNIRPFLTGRMFLREPSSKYSAKLYSAKLYSAKLYSGSKNLRSTCSGNIRPIGRSLPLIGREQSSPVNEEKNGWRCR